MRKINKKGFLLAEETMKMMISIICILFLALLLFYIYYYYAQRTTKEMELAKASLKYLVNGINQEEEEIEIDNPSGWILVSFSESEIKPKICKGRSCLCICKMPAGAVKTPDVSCDAALSGTCLENDFNVGTKILFGTLPFYSIEIKDPPLFLAIDFFNKKIARESVEFAYARASLKHLIEDIKAGKTETEISEPNGWVLTSWPFEKNIPKKCVDNGWKNCLCICKSPGYEELPTIIEQCDRNEFIVCLENNFLVEQPYFLKPINAIVLDKPPLKLSIDQENKIIKTK